MAPVLASGLKRISTRKCVFVIASLAAESPQESPHRYDEVVSGRSVYEYVGGNSINYVDPTGQCPWCVVAGGAAVGGVAAFVGTKLGGGSWGDAVEAIPGGALGGAAAAALWGVEAVSLAGAALGIVADVGINAGIDAISVAGVISPAHSAPAPNSAPNSAPSSAPNSAAAPNQGNANAACR